MFPVAVGIRLHLRIAEICIENFDFWTEGFEKAEKFFNTHIADLRY